MRTPLPVSAASFFELKADAPKGAYDFKVRPTFILGPFASYESNKTDEVDRSSNLRARYSIASRHLPWALY
jgi:hypothetical protein